MPIKLISLVLATLASIYLSIVPASAEPLQAHIQHSHEVAPVSPGLRAAASLIKKAYQKS